MGLVLLFLAGLWGLGALMGTPWGARLTMMGVFYAGLVLAHLVLPAEAPLRLATGKTAAPWLIFGGLAALAGAYAALVRQLRAKAALKDAARSPAPPAGGAGFGEGELERYARHIVLRELGGPGQRALKQARVLVIGAGGLGSPALLYLAAAGVGRIGVIDDDKVENGNLQRQVIHRDAEIGKPKVLSAYGALKALNPYIEVFPYERRLDDNIAADLFDEYDLILDGSDNFDTRYLANQVAVAQGKPLISGALSQWEGQVSVFDPAQGAPCYRCIFPDPPAPGLAPSCAEAGVLGPLPGVVGAMMAVEAIKLIAEIGAPLRGEMLIYDALWGETRKIALKPRADCPVCGAARNPHPPS